MLPDLDSNQDSLLQRQESYVQARERSGSYISTAERALNGSFAYVQANEWDEITDTSAHCCRTWIRTKIACFRGRSPTIRRSGSIAHKKRSVITLPSERRTKALLTIRSSRGLMIAINRRALGQSLSVPAKLKETPAMQ